MSEENMEEKELKEVKIYYEKSNQHRTINITGAWAGVTPSLGVQLALYNDLRAMPEFTANKVTDEGKLGQEIGRLERDGLIRETEVTVIMSPQVAVEFIGIIQQMLDQINTIESKRTLQSTEDSKKE